jgi:hypothetical protein
MRCFAKKILHESRTMGRGIIMMRLICSLGHCECDGHTVHKLSQRRLTADWLAPRDSDCSRMRSKVSSDWLPSYINATRPVLEIFKMAEYFLDSPCTVQAQFLLVSRCSMNWYIPFLWFFVSLLFFTIITMVLPLSALATFRLFCSSKLLFFLDYIDVFYVTCCVYLSQWFA